MGVIIIPKPCGKAVPFYKTKRCGDSGYFFGHTYCSDNCKPLGAQLANAGTYVDHDECGPCWEYALTWNLTLAALLNAAAIQAIEEVLAVEQTLSKSVTKILTGRFQGEF